MPTEPSPDRPCPQCGTAMGVDARFVTWCASCEWNADPEPEQKPTFVARLLSRQQDRLARRLYADVVAEHRFRRGGAGVAVTAWLLAGLVHLLTLAVLAGAAYVLFTGLIWPVRYVLAAFLVALAAVLQPFRRDRKRRLIPASLLVGAIGSTFGLLAQRQGQRCEYYADELAARAAGSAAAATLTDKLLIADACSRTVARTLKFGNGADPWEAVAEFAASVPAKEWERRRVVGRRRLNRIDTSHPPSIFRSELLRARPPVDGAVRLSAERSAQIDAELATVKAEVMAQLRG
ncbi:MAG TPA: hypothetical protein VFI65_30440 [Streptosporangiaceae bacterium]|nr:hypothetical protein [Streptosporangiaceae bacterium]